MSDREIEPEEVLSKLLANGTIFVNNGWWDDQWPKDHITVHVTCNDVFAWGTADSENISYSELSDLYSMIKKDPDWGAAAWCIKKRKRMPQKPVEDCFAKRGVWDLKELIKN